MKIKTFLINLDSSEERLAAASKQLNSAHWKIDRYSAYDGRGKKLEDFSHYDDKTAQKILGRSMLNSELGCYLSHYGCVESFLETDADYLVVLEDDLKITPEFGTILEGIIDCLQSLDHSDWYLLNIAAKNKKITKEIARVKGHAVVHAYYFPIRGLGLVWNRKGAQEFLNLGKNANVPVDIFFQNWLSRNGKGLSVWPALVKPAGLDSDILGTVAKDGVRRKEKEQRDFSFFWKKQKRILINKIFALLFLIKSF